MKGFISVFVSVLALFVGVCRSVPVSTTKCISCQTLKGVCNEGNCTNAMENGKCNFNCICPLTKTGPTCGEDKPLVNMPVVKETVQVRVNPVDGLDLALFGPQAVNPDFFHDVGPPANATSVPAVPTLPTTPRPPTSGPGASGALGAINPQRSQTGSSSGQSAGRSSTSTGRGQSPTGSTSSASSPAAASGTAGAAGKQAARPGPQSPAEVPNSSPGGSSSSADVPTPGTFRTQGAASPSDSLALVQFSPPTQQETTSGTAPTDMLNKLHRLYSGAHLGASLSSAGSAAQQSGASTQQSGTNTQQSGTSAQQSGTKPGGSAVSSPAAASSSSSSAKSSASSGSGFSAFSPK